LALVEKKERPGDVETIRESLAAFGKTFVPAAK
jgi:hypothetical protein